MGSEHTVVWMWAEMVGAPSREFKVCRVAGGSWGPLGKKAGPQKASRRGEATEAPEG